MKNRIKMIIGIFLMILVFSLIAIIYGSPEQRKYAEEMARRSFQSKTFQIHVVEYTFYNVIANEYNVKLCNVETEEKFMACVRYNKDGKTIEEIRRAYE